jgi:hypothetical protein
MNPDKVVIAIGTAELPLSKQYYNKTAVMANYTREIAEMLQVVSSLKPIDDEPIPEAKKASLYEKADRIVNFEKRLAVAIADPDQASKIEVS